jgi:hypothetical protein
MVLESIRDRLKFDLAEAEDAAADKNREVGYIKATLAQYEDFLAGMK